MTRLEGKKVGKDHPSSALLSAASDFDCMVKKVGSRTHLNIAPMSSPAKLSRSMQFMRR
jgi:hypothetical protein